jgi:hypothetical protein
LRRWFFFLKEDALQTPADALALVAEIAKLHRETAKDLMSSLLIKARVVSHNIQVWQDVLIAYETGQLSNLPPLSQLPKSLQDIFNQIKSYLDAIPSDLTTFEQGVSQRLKELGVTPLSDSQTSNIQTPLPVISEDKARTHLERILNIASNEKEDSSRLQRLLRRLEANILKTPPIVNESYESIEPKKWLLTEVAERGQQLMLDKMEPSKAMIRVFKQKHPDKPLPKNVREWIKVMGINEEMSKLRRQLLEAERMSLNEEQQKQYQAAYQSVEQEIQKILETTTADEQQKNLKWDQFPPHPVLARWGEIEEIIDKLPQGPVKDKIRAVFGAKRELAKKQEYYTNLFLETTIKSMPGGYYGWNERLKGVLQPLLEASPYFASLFKEPNCVGRMILLSGMLMEAQVFEEKDLVIMSIYWHTFLGSFDALRVGKVIEGSGYPIHSYFGIPKEKVFQGKVFDNQEIILQLPLQIGLLN